MQRENIPHELLPHPHTETARDEALAVGLLEVAKTIVVFTDRGYVRTVIPADGRLDLHKIRAALESGKDTRLATEEELAEAYPMFEIGAVPPFGGPTGDRGIIDRRLADRDALVFAAGTHDESVRLRTRDVIRLAEAVIADICED